MIVRYGSGHDDLYPAVAGTVLGGVVGGHGVVLGIAYRRYSPGRKVMFLDEVADDLRGAPHRKLPVGPEFRGRDGYIVSVAFDAQGIVTVPSVRLIRPLGALLGGQLELVEKAVIRWLGFEESGA